MENVQAQPFKFSNIVTTRSYILFFLPIIACVSAVAIGNLIFLDYVHVLSGGIWTGIDLFMGFIVGPVIGKLKPPAKAEVIKNLVPYMLFFMPSIASVAVTSGYYLASSYGVFIITSPAIMVAGVLIILLMIQGFGIFLPNEVRIFLELSRPAPDVGKMSRLAMMNFRLSGVQGVMQIALIFIMANIANNNLYLHF